MTNKAPLNSQWTFLTGDLNWMDYNGQWIKNIDNDTYIVIELINLHDAMDHNHPNKYLMEIHEVTLSEVDQKTLHSALKHYCYLDEPTITNEMKVEALVSYGGYSTWNEEGNNYQKLFKEALNQI